MDFEKKEFHAYIYLDIFLIFDPKFYLFNFKLFILIIFFLNKGHYTERPLPSGGKLFQLQIKGKGTQKNFIIFSKN
jgi:hypothetical protein